MWAREPHLAGETRLARYYDFGDTPAPESLKDETDHYRKVASYFLNHPEQDRGYLVRGGGENGGGTTAGEGYSVQICGVATTMEKAECEESEQIRLGRGFYSGERSIRDLGVGVAFPFGRTGA